MSSPDPMTRLLDAAEYLIAERGWAATTTRAVAERAGLTQGLVHYHARSIDGLRREACLRAIRRFFDQPIEGYDPTPAGARAWILGLLSPAHSSPSGYQELRVLHESLPAANRDERLRTDIANLLEQYRESIAAVLRGHGHTEAMSSALAKTITATVDGAVLQRSLDPTFDMTSIAEILATALGTPPASTGSN